MDSLLSLKKPMGPIALYTFYYYTAIWQETNVPKCTVAYAAQGLKISKDIVRKHKKSLQQLGLIKDIQNKDKEGKFGSHFVQVNYYEKPPSGKTIGRVTHSRENPEPNAYNNNNKNAYSNNNKNGSLKDSPSTLLKTIPDTFEQKIAKRINKMLKNAKGKTITRIVRDSSWENQIRKLLQIKGITKEEVKEVFIWYVSNYDDEFTPKLYKIKDVYDKYPRIRAASLRRRIMTKEQQERKEAGKYYGPPNARTKFIFDDQGFEIGIKYYDAKTKKLLGKRLYD